MTSNKKKLIFHVVLKVLFLLITLTVLVFFSLRSQWIYALIAVPFVIWAVIYFIRYTFRVNQDINEFVEAIHYRDFTRYYALKNSPATLQTLRNGLNEINDAFKTVMREKETQSQYLRQILEMVDTGILSFEAQSGRIHWMNEALKEMLSIPYLKNIERLAVRNNDLFLILKGMENGDSKIVTLKKGAGHIKVLLNMTAFQTDEKRFRLVAFQNVSEAMDETETKAWQRLLNVMTHEIMNSVGPIASLADTLKRRLQQGIEDHEEDLRADIALGIDTIKRRSEGLTKFAETYRNLSKISKLEKTKFLVLDMLEAVYRILYPNLQKKHIELQIKQPDRELTVDADRNLLEQVLINLILNAVEAVKGKTNGRIILSAASEDNKTLITVTDNGKGIPPDLMDQIYIPFFSTRKNGNGIGLSLCKQIMHLHDGSLSLRSEEGRYTSFTMALKR